MSVPLFCIALLGLLVILLGFRVSLARASSNTVYGGEIDPVSPLYKAQRAHGNTVEYAPILAIMMLALAQAPQPGWVLWSMILATFFRYLFAAGILFPATMAKPNPMRFIGALGTYLTGISLAVALVIQAVNT
ncbi:MAPEG family protein [Parahaliea maris]|uniref:MAPEG family protein n=1 Tax=Parahaliea maris TaxID=2716870 RepID=A0A5C8ZWT4_9GAMM|nr:MAPEG family protein [Parahaliea maris]TXS92918.1 MAPEG family protein [Parahaliea maris]